MSDSLKIDKSGFDRIVKRINNPKVQQELLAISNRREVAAIVAQAIADNFDKEGPGWAPLKAATIRASISKKWGKEIANMSDEELEKYEKRARKKGTVENEAGAFRKILQKSRLLYRTATTPFATQTGNGKTGSTSWSVEGKYLVYHVDLVYAGIHNSGDPKRNIPQRKFLTVRDEWMKKLEDYYIQESMKILKQYYTEGAV